MVWQAVVGVNCPHELASDDPGELCVCATIQFQCKVQWVPDHTHGASNAGVYTVYTAGVYTMSYTLTHIVHTAVCLAKLIKLG